MFMKDQNLIAIGDIVALKSHPYTNQSTHFGIAGDPQLVSPLMVVVEQINDFKDLYDELTGIKIQDAGVSSQCKCLWYSSKSSQFEEAWLSSKLLKLIQKSKAKKPTSPFEIGTIVTLSTAKLELSKIKNSSRIERTKESFIAAPLLSFVSPLMQVIGTVKQDSVTSYDSKTGKSKKEVASLLVKCKWFNASTDKMSEKHLPFEALTIIPPVDEDKLKKIQGVIDNKEYLKMGNQTIVKPHEIQFSHGEYYLVAYDYVKNKIRHDFRINDIEFSDDNVKPSYYSDRYTHNSEDKATKKDWIERLNASTSFLRITYKDLIGNITIRTIHSYEVQENIIDAFCELRQSDRHFRLEGILKLEELDLSRKVKK